MKKAGYVEAKANLQPPFYVGEIDCRCLKDHYLLVKKDKDNANQEYRNKTFNKDKKKAKSHNPSSANQPQIKVFKEYQRSWQGVHSTTRVNAIEVAKKDKDKVKDLSYVKYYTCKLKGHYVNKCPEKSKN